MSTLASSVPHASLLLALQLSARPLHERELAAITGLPEIRVRSALRELSLQKHVAAAPAEGSPDGGSGAPAWAITRIEPDLLEDMAETLCSACPDTGVPYHMGVLGGDATLEDCEIVVRFIDDRLKDNEPAVFACFEMVVQFLLRWGRAHMDDAGQKSWRYAELVLVVQSMCIFSHHYLQLATELSPLAYELSARNGSERFMPMIWIFRHYLQLFSGGEPPLTDRFFHGSEKMRHFKEQDMQDRIPVFEGIENFLKGHFRETLQCYARRPAQDHWWYKRFFEPLSFCASQAAMYLREYPLATGIIESARQTAELAGERLVAVLWIAHLCFLLLRKGALDEAIVKIDYLLNCVPPEQNHKVASSAVRALAVYHHLSGRTDAAYRVLRNETLRAAARGVPHSPFLDPLVLDLLYVFEQRGYPPIPRYEVEATIETFLRQPNRQLRGTALRVHALRLRGRGAPAEEVVSLLHDSLRELEPTGRSPANSCSPITNSPTCLKRWASTVKPTSSASPSPRSSGTRSTKTPPTAPPPSRRPGRRSQPSSPHPSRRRRTRRPHPSRPLPRRLQPRTDLLSERRAVPAPARHRAAGAPVRARRAVPPHRRRQAGVRGLGQPHPHGAGKRRDAELYGMAGKHPPQCRLHPQ